MATTTFSQWMRCAIFQTKTDLLVIYQNVNIFTQETLYPSFISKKISTLHRKGFSKHPLFTTFSLFEEWVKFVIFQINADFLMNQSTKYFYTKHLTLLLHAIKKFALSITKSFKNIHFLTDFYNFSQWMSCAIFQINTNLQVICQNINTFTYETLYTSFISKKNWRFPSQMLFETSTFYHIFTISKS